MAIIAEIKTDINTSLERANEIFRVRGYSVRVRNEKVEMKQPVFLQLVYADGTTRNVGITHLVHLRGKDWDNLPLEEIARTTDEVAQAIITRVGLFFDAEKRGLYIDENGTIFDFNGVNIKIHEDKTFSIGDKVVTYNDSPLELTRIKGEGIVQFIPREKGIIELGDAIDKREGKGIFIDAEGKIFRG